MTNQLPDPAFLVKKFDLLKKGRQNGSFNMPPATEPGLDPVEAEVASWCHSALQNRLEVYRKEQDTLTGRMKLERPEEDADAMAEESCQAMQNMILTAKVDLEGHRGRVEESRNKLRIIEEKYGLDGSEAPKMPRECSQVLRNPYGLDRRRDDDQRLFLRCEPPRRPPGRA